jgi:hypothetical protein
MSNRLVQSGRQTTLFSVNFKSSFSMFALALFAICLCISILLIAVRTVSTKLLPSRSISNLFFFDVCFSIYDLLGCQFVFYQISNSVT